jgi:hypothetical protein
MNRLALLLGSALLIAGCSGGPPAPSATTSAASASPMTAAPSAAPTPAPTLALRPTPTPVQAGHGLCPTASPLTPWDFTGSDAACFGGDDVEIRGWIDRPPPIGYGPPGIAPLWLFGPNDGLSTIWGAPPTGPDMQCADDRGCALFFVQFNPASGLSIEGPRRWLILTGHRQDPAAETCHYVYPEGWTGERYDDAEAVAKCREGFVLVSFRDAP